MLSRMKRGKFSLPQIFLLSSDVSIFGPIFPSFPQFSLSSLLFPFFFQFSILSPIVIFSRFALFCQFLLSLICLIPPVFPYSSRFVCVRYFYLLSHFKYSVRPRVSNHQDRRTRPPSRSHSSIILTRAHSPESDVPELKVSFVTLLLGVSPQLFQLPLRRRVALLAQHPTEVVHGFDFTSHLLGVYRAVFIRAQFSQGLEGEELVYR